MKSEPAAHKQLENLDRLQRADHDILIEVRTHVGTIMSDVKEIRDGTAQRMATLEGRTDALENEVLKATTTLRTIKWFLGGVVVTVSFIIATLSGIFDLLGH